MNSAVKRLLIEVGLLFLLIFLISKVNPLFGKLLLIAYFAYKLFSLRYTFYSVKGKKLYDAGDKDGAIKWYGKAIKVHSCRPRTFISYGYLLLIEGKVDEAREIIARTENDSLDPREKINYYTTKALIEWKSNNLNSAIEILEEANKDLKALMIYESLGYLLVISKDYDKALQFNLEAYDYDSNDEIIIDNLGETYYFLGQYDKSKELYENLIKRNLSFPEPFYYLALIYLTENREDEAKELLEKALSCPQGFLTALSKEDIEKALKKLDTKAIE